MSDSIRTIPVRVGPDYEVTIGPGLLRETGPRLSALLGRRRIAVLTDSAVAPLYLDTVTASLEDAGFSVCSRVFPAGEGSKNLSTLSDLLEFLASEHLTRTDCVAALGGGVTGDMAGFAAAVYLRGIRYVQLPTTLLAAVDSSVGGKTAVDLAAGKNLAGAFCQPAAVLCDTDCLTSLPPHVFADKEQGERRLLNLGHTVGHAIEKCSGYAIPHGHAVAAGLAVIARASEQLGWADVPIAERIAACLAKNGLPTGTDFPAEALAEAALSDKKRAGGDITLVVPRAIGRCELKKLPVAELLPVIRAGLEA